MATFAFELVSPERLLITGKVEQVRLPGAEGEFVVMANHAPQLALLGPGIIEVSGGDVAAQRLFVDGGFCDVGPNGCTVLAEAAIAADGDAPAAMDALIAESERSIAAMEDLARRDEAERRLATLRTVRAQLN